jgi:hypothetical protein
LGCICGHTNVADETSTLDFSMRLALCHEEGVRGNVSLIAGTFFLVVAPKLRR